jgi:predicted DNA-binding antitoxin AbrB/MazE fold protein
MSVIEAVYRGGVFHPLAEVGLPENQRVRLAVEPAAGTVAQDWLTATANFRQQLLTTSGLLPDSAPDIAADRRHE